jgi:type II secretory pathway component PulF
VRDVKDTMSGKAVRRRSALRRVPDQRALLTLLALALESARPERALEEGARHWRRGRLQRAARALAAGLGEGEALSRRAADWLPGHLCAALSAGEERGDLPGGVERALDILSRIGRARGLFLRASLYPLTVACIVLGMAGVFAAAALPAVEALRRETALLAGRPEPDGLLSLLAAHPLLLAVAGLTAALLPLLAPAGFTLLGRGRAGGRLLLALPLAGEASRLRATADFAGTLGDHLAAGAPLDAAWTAAAGPVANAALRHDLMRAASLLRGGDPIGEALEAAGLPRHVAFAFAPHRTRADNGVAAAREAAARAAEEHRRLATLGGRLAAAAGYSVAALGVLALFAALYLPLLEAARI